jgi:hypothetical protein
VDGQKLASPAFSRRSAPALGVKVMRQFARALTTVTASLVLAGCAALPEKFTMYPQLLKEGEKIDSDMAVVLVGIQGPLRINYLQFGHASRPAINVRFPGQGDSIVAVALPAGLSKVTLMTTTVEGRPATYIGSMPVGFIGVHTPPLDLAKPGLYFIATIDPSRPRQFSIEPDREQLNEFRRKFGATIATMQPVNFQWSE